MIRIMRERIDIYAEERDFYDDIVLVQKALNVPCEMTPLSSKESIDGGSTTVDTRYLLVTRSTVMGTFEGSSYTIVWRGAVFRIQGNMEDYYFNGRLQHREAVVRHDPAADLP